MKPFIPTAILLCCLSVLVFAFLIPINPSNQLAAVASAQTTSDFSFKQSSYTVQEGNVVRITIVAPQNLTKTTRLPIRIQSGTAKSGSDFRLPTTSTVTFYKGGLKEKTVSIATIKDSKAEEPETFTVRLGTSGPQVTVAINDKATTTSTTSQNPPVNCPSPYVRLNTDTTTYPVTLISRPFSYIPWGSSTLGGDKYPFPGLVGSSWGNGGENPSNKALLDIGTVQAYEFTVPSETWDGNPKTKAFYQTRVDPSPEYPNGIKYGEGKLVDGYFQLAFSPDAPAWGSSGNPSHLACYSAALTMSIDECPGVIDQRRYPEGIQAVGFEGVDASRVEWRHAGDKYLRKTTGSGGSTAFDNKHSLELLPGKKYYFNMSYVWAQEQFSKPEDAPKPGEAVTCSFRLTPRAYLPR